MFRDLLIVGVALFALTVVAYIAYDLSQQERVILPGNSSGVTQQGNWDPKIAITTPKLPDVLLFTDIGQYADWFHIKPAGLEARLPELVDFQKHQVVVISWGEKPTSGYVIILDSQREDEQFAYITVQTVAPHGPVHAEISTPAVTTVVTKAKPVKIQVKGDRFKPTNLYGDFLPMQGLGYELEVLPEESKR